MADDQGGVGIKREAMQRAIYEHKGRYYDHEGRELEGTLEEINRRYLEQYGFRPILRRRRLHLWPPGHGRP